jgi:hypothetical protein
MQDEREEVTSDPQAQSSAPSVEPVEEAEVSSEADSEDAEGQAFRRN